MNLSSNRNRLMEDALAPAFIANSLAATRRAACRRRVRRRMVRAAALGCVVMAGTWLFLWAPRHDRPVSATSRQAAPPFVLVTNTSLPSTVVLRTAAAPPGLMVTTRAAPVSVPNASRDEVFASAGERPGGLIQLADGSARWMWLDLPELK